MDNIEKAFEQIQERAVIRDEEFEKILNAVSQQEQVAAGLRQLSNLIEHELKPLREFLSNLSDPE